MEFMLDTADIGAITRLVAGHPITGVTTNPSILKRAGRIDLYGHLRAIRDAIGPDRELHVQVVAGDTAGMVDDAHRLVDHLDATVFVKVPATSEGVPAIRALAEEGLGVTATAIYSSGQALLALAAGATYIAPYYNRMEALDIDAAAVIRSVSGIVDRASGAGRILGASFKNMRQVVRALEAGCHAVTIDPELIASALDAPPVTAAVEAFTSDWVEAFGTRTLP